MNAYAYCQNDPINKVAPSGNIPHYLRSVAKWIGNITGLRKPSSNPGGTLSIINEPGVRDKIFSQLPAKDLGNLASTSKAFHLEIGELTIKNVKKLDANIVPAATQGKVEGILPINTKRKCALHNSVIQKIENLPAMPCLSWRLCVGHLRVRRAPQFDRSVNPLHNCRPLFDSKWRRLHRKLRVTPC